MIDEKVFVGLPTTVFRTFESYSMSSDGFDEHFLKITRSVGEEEGDYLTTVCSLADRNDSWSTSGQIRGFSILYHSRCADLTYWLASHIVCTYLLVMSEDKPAALIIFSLCMEESVSHLYRAASAMPLTSLSRQTGLVRCQPRNPAALGR